MLAAASAKEIAIAGRPRERTDCAACGRSPRRIATHGPPASRPDLIVVHGISLPPGEFGGPWIDRLFTNALPADAHPYFAEIAGSARLLASLHPPRRQRHPICEIHASGPGMRDNRARRAAPPATTSRSAWSSKVPTRVPYDPLQYQALARGRRRALRSLSQRLSPERLVGHSDISPGPQDRSRARVRLGARSPPDRRLPAA